MSRGGKRPGAGRPIGSVVLPPVKDEIKEGLRETAQRYKGTAVKTLIEICEKGKSESARVAAANSLLDRGYGKPVQPVDSTIRKAELTEINDAELEHIATGSRSGTSPPTTSAPKPDSVH